MFPDTPALPAPACVAYDDNREIPGVVAVPEEDRWPEPRAGKSDGSRLRSASPGAEVEWDTLAKYSGEVMPGQLMNRLEKL